MSPFICLRSQVKDWVDGCIKTAFRRSISHNNDNKKSKTNNANNSNNDDNNSDTSGYIKSKNKANLRAKQVQPK